MRAFIGWLRAQFSAEVVGDRATQTTSGHQAPAITAGGNVVVTYIQEASSFRRGDRRVPRQLPDRPVGGHLYGRDAELQTLSGRLKRGQHSAVVGPAGLGKTALAAEAVRIVIGDNDESLQASPFPDGVVLLDLYIQSSRGRHLECFGERTYW